MDINKGKRNVIVSISFKIITLLMSIAVKRVLISACGNEVNGLNALYLSIIGVLSVAELGLGSAITFCMYKPIVEGREETVSALYHLIRKLYIIIGLTIFSAGLLLLPFLKIFAKDYAELNVNMYLTFFLILVSVVASYMFNAKLSLMNAYKNNYITTAITQGGGVLRDILQIAVLFITGSFVGYLICRIISVLIQWCVTELTFKDYRRIAVRKARLDSETKRQVKTSVKAMLMHKIGRVLVNSVDSIIISAFVGVIALGEYSNYSLILTSISEIVVMVFTSLTSVIGHLCAKENKQISHRYFECFHLLNFIMGTFFSLGYYAVIDCLVSILFSSELVLDRSISFVITLNGFIQLMRQCALTFKDATGAFYSDRWKPLSEGICNTILSIVFVKIIGVSGVILATIITNIIISHVVEPYVLHKNAFDSSPKEYYFWNYSMIVAFTVALAMEDLLIQHMENLYLELLVNGAISVGISFTICGMMVFFRRNTWKYLFKILKKG